MTTEPTDGASRSSGALNVGAFAVVFFFVWLVFDNLALAFLFGLIAGSGTAVAQNAANGRRKE